MPPGHGIQGDLIWKAAAQLLNFPFQRCSEPPRESEKVSENSVETSAFPVFPMTLGRFVQAFELLRKAFQELKAAAPPLPSYELPTLRMPPWQLPFGVPSSD